MVLNQKEFSKMLAMEHGCSIKEANLFVDDFLELLVSQLEKDCEVNFKGFGKFYKKRKEERVSKNPFSKGEVIIPAFDTVLFKAGQTVKNRINDVEEEFEDEY